MSAEPEEVQALHLHRFGDAEVQRSDLCRVLCEDFFQRWVPLHAFVVAAPLA